MDHFAGLDISMDETHICVVDREGVVVYESKTASTAEAIADKLSDAPSCHRIVFETGRMAPILFHGLSQLGLPAVCVESRQAYQALRSLATHKTDRNDARGLAHLARTGFFKPVHVKSLSAHALRSLILARKKLVGQRVTLENQIRGLAVVAGQHDIGGLVQQGPHPPVAAFRDAADVVDLPGLIAFWNEAQIGADVSRDRRMRDGSSIAATKASAVSWPTPGIVMSRRQASEALVMRLMSASIAATALMTAVRAASSPRTAAERPATGQGADLLETRGWDDRASDVIEV